MVASPATPPPTNGFTYELCKREGKLRLLFLFSSAAVGLMVIWLFLALAVASLDAGTGSVVVATINVVVAGSLAIVSGYAMRRCERDRALRREAYSDPANRR